MNTEIASNLEQLQQELTDFIDFYQQDHDYTAMIYERWNAKDILGHITFWHESFAANIADLGNGRKPNPLKGKLSEVNQLSVASTASSTINDLITRLQQAQQVIEQHIFNETIELIPYKKGSRDYSRMEHLAIVAHHIHKHLKDLKKKFK
ncbi:MAG: hypothetical protein ACPGJS_05030 [Flammeovirgaceae bacterium]